MKTQIRGPRLLLSAGIAFTLAVGMLAGARTAHAGGPTTVGLGTAAPFAILAGEAVTNTGPSTITGNLGIHPGDASDVTGFPPGTVNGTIHAANAVALQAKGDLGIAYLDAFGRTGSAVASGDLANLTLVAGVYNSDGEILDLTGPLTLDGQNDPTSVWIFQASSSLITASGSTVSFINGGNPCNVFWQVTSSATLGSGSIFVGTILAQTSIFIDSDVTVNGRALAQTGEVTLIDDTIGSLTCPGAGPLPSAAPSVPSAAFSPENEAVSPWSLFLVLSGVAALFISFIVTVRRLTARQGI